MQARTRPTLHRDNPQRDQLAGNVKVTREDWLNIARDVLVNDGMGDVKILGLADRLGVSRSSFYWYFADRDDLLTALLHDWETRNTTRIAEHCRMPAATITQAVCNFFLCFIDPSKFDRGLDFAIREWARRDVPVRAKIEAADAARLRAVTAMFARHGYKAADADARARILYFMQLGYHALDVREPMQARLARLGPYILGFTGQSPDPAVLTAFLTEIERLDLD